MNRWCFCQLKDRGFASAPDFKGFTPEEKLYMQSEAQRLMNCPTQVNVESVRKAMKKWDKKIQEETSKSDDRIRFNLHKRAIIMGFRAGALCMVLEDSPRMAAKFATWVADYALDELMSLFGSKLKEQRRKMSLPIRNAKTASLFDSLNNEFTRRELIEARKKAGESVKTSSISTIIGRWQHSGFITDLGDDRFKKSL